MRCTDTRPGAAPGRQANDALGQIEHLVRQRQTGQLGGWAARLITSGVANGAGEAALEHDPSVAILEVHRIANLTRRSRTALCYEARAGHSPPWSSFLPDARVDVACLGQLLVILYITK